MRMVRASLYRYGLTYVCADITGMGEINVYSTYNSSFGVMTSCDPGYFGVASRTKLINRRPDAIQRSFVFRHFHFVFVLLVLWQGEVVAHTGDWRFGVSSGLSKIDPNQKESQIKLISSRSVPKWDA